MLERASEQLKVALKSALYEFKMEGHDIGWTKNIL